MSVQDEVRSALESPLRETFLQALGSRLGFSARLIFTEGSPEGLEQARACNEMMIVIWAQFSGSGEVPGEGYPNDVFLPVLREKADAGGARHHLRDAVEGALHFLGHLQAPEA
ncbi:hypothetical protein LE181_28775 [Streptomyces sp. SCA3-4]|uniref:hypothetical protein n=1 Tax=Streptomyces sichuanensis TaxID=2871810 RepID=UPI001CE37FB0|nr:hypothetical protein [Streptomyces sichuanensis]MCA6096144.1 hypothetical protein [Streptomyces sichuanensis]